MSKDKLHSFDKKYFLIPFLILLVLTITITYLFLNERISERYEEFETTAHTIASTYEQLVEHSQEAYTSISRLLDEKLSIAINAVMLYPKNNDRAILSDLAKGMQVDEIYLYDASGTIINSNTGEYIGWKAYEGHPVYDFMTGSEDLYVEDIRGDSESGILHKYAYVKNTDGTFIQIGVLADSVKPFLDHFEHENLVYHAANTNEDLDISFVTTDDIIKSSSNVDLIGIKLDDERILSELRAREHQVLRATISHDDLFFMGIPIFQGSAMIGSLAITWDTEVLDRLIRSSILRAFLQFVFTVVLLGGILYYAYRKNRANIRLAYYDELTELPNESYLREYLDEIVTSKTIGHAVLLLNLRNLRLLNMLYGLLLRNQVIHKVAESLQVFNTSGNGLFSYGTDQFVLVMSAFHERSELEQLARDIISVCDSSIATIVEQQNLSIRIAIVEIGEDIDDVDTLMQHASLTLSVDPTGVDQTIRFFEGSMESMIRREDRIEKAIRKIIKRDESGTFFLHFQPTKSITENQIVGFEALARMNLPDLGFVSPLEFIDIAEKRTLIYDLGIQIFHLACSFIKEAREAGYPSVRVAVNVSLAQMLREQFLPDLQSIITFHGIEANALVLEITESMLFRDFDRVNEKLQDIKEMGIAVALDDFGTGYSSFSRLKELHIDTVKIDRAFIKSIKDENDMDAIVSDIISMSHRLGLIVVAEGVETESQLSYLKHHECDVIQGYHFSKPLPPKDALQFLSSHTIASPMG